jgi:hypothetical protein
MRTISIAAAVASLFAVLAACGPKQDATQQPTAAPTATYGYPPQPGAYPQQPGAYPQQPAPQATYGYPQQAAPPPQYGAPAQAPSPAPMPTPAPAGSTGQMAVPGAVAFQCTNDVPCGTHHCNTQYGKCAFPCQSNVDCITPNACVMGLCVPPMPQAAPPH